MTEVRGKLWGLLSFSCFCVAIISIFQTTPLIFAQSSYIIEGIVLDSETGFPVCGADIQIGHQHKTTDDEGRFYFDNLIPQDYEISISHVAYFPKVQKAVVIDGSNPALTVYLEPVVYIQKPLTIESKRESRRIIFNSEETPRPIDEFLHVIPGISVIEGDGAVKLSIRGCRPSEILVVVDGIPLPKNARGEIDLKLLSTSQIESIEIITDNIPARYSAIAPGGLVIIKTRKSEPSYIESGFTWGSWSAYSGDIKLGLALPLDFNLNASAKYTTSAGDFEYDTEDSSAIRENNRSGMSFFEFSAGRQSTTSDIKFAASYSAFDEGMPGALDVPTPLAKRKGWSFNSRLKTMLVLPGTVLLDADAAIFDGNRHYYSPRPYVYVPVDSDHRTNGYGVCASLSREFRFISPEIGGEFREEGYELTNNLNSDMNIPRKSREIGSMWLETPVLFEIGTLINSKISPAVRWDVIDNEKPVRRVSIEASTSFCRWGANLGFSGGYAESFRMPGFQDLYWLRYAFAEGNPDLAPEETYKRHIRLFGGYCREWLEIDFGADFFSRTVDSVIVWNRGFDGLYRPVNFSREESHGRQDIIEIRLGSYVQFRWSNTLIEALHRKPGDYLDGKWLPFRPAYLQQAQINLRYKDFRLGLDSRMIGKRYILAANTKWTEPYSVWNIRAGYSFSVHKIRISVSASAENIFDKDYEVLVGYPMPGRSFSAGIGLRFGEKPKM